MDYVQITTAQRRHMLDTIGIDDTGMEGDLFHEDWITRPSFSTADARPAVVFMGSCSNATPCH